MIYNGTIHEINFYRELDTYPVQNGRKLVLKKGSKPYKTIEPGKNLSLKLKQDLLEIKDGVNIFIQKAVDEDDPKKVLNPPEGSVIIVSALYALNVKNKDRYSFVTVGGTVYEDEKAIRPVGCTYLIKN